MRSADETAEAARRMAQLRWTPEARMRAAVRYAAKHAGDLDAIQREQLREIAGPEEKTDE